MLYATTSPVIKACAHRNRIAAQNSHEKRKARFSYQERRVAELEEENRKLRAGGLVPPPAIPLSTFVSVFPSDSLRTDISEPQINEPTCHLAHMQLFYLK